MLASIDPYTRKWDRDGNESTSSSDQVDSDAHCLGPRAVYWYYDQSTFYANDRRNTRWVHKSEKAQPKAKGEGASLMIADFVSPDYGWLQSPDGTESARVYFHAGKNRDGYFTTQNILDQASVAMDILEKHYPHDKHYLIYDNAPHQVARPPVALSARHMTKFPTQVGHVPFGVDVEVIGSDGQKVFGRNGQVLRRRVQMVGGKLPSGAPQSFYYPPGHPNAGAFKGMVAILEERGFSGVHQLRAECEGFKCPNWTPDSPCCCRRLLFNQPDFCAVEPALVGHCKRRGVSVIYLPKFHCELNCIEQCWGAAKRVYREYPPSTHERTLAHNVQTTLATVSVKMIRR